MVDALAADPNRREQLTDLLREDHHFYNQRGAATVVRMRGWVLLAVARIGLADDALVFVLEELDTGVDAYLVAAAAYALRSYQNPNPSIAPFVMRAIAQIRYHDNPVSFEAYGDYAVSGGSTSPVLELLVTLAWLGPHARDVRAEIEVIAQSRGLSKKAQIEANRTLEIIRGTDTAEEHHGGSCCELPGGLLSKFYWSRRSRRASEPLDSIIFEDQDGESVSFKEFFHGHPSIVVFFYTRCENPLKCSLTVTKLSRIQTMLESRGLSDQIHTAAITYDPAFDLAERIRGYGKNRSVSMDAHHRMLRAPDGIDALRQHFKLGVNFIESLVNRHRLEAYVLDGSGRIAASFQRLHWDEQEVVERAVEVLTERDVDTASVDLTSPELPVSPAEVVGVSLRGHPSVHDQTAPANLRTPIDRSPHNSLHQAKPVHSKWQRSAASVMGTLASLAVAFFPKCPICWAAYLSVLGIAGLNQIPYSPWLQPVLGLVMLINIVSVWLRGRGTGRMGGAYLVTAGALAIVLSRIGSGWEKVAIVGVILTVAGSLLSAFGSRKNSSASRSYRESANRVVSNREDLLT